MSYLDERHRKRAQARNVFHSVALVIGIGLIAALSAYTLLGKDAVIWALVVLVFFSFAGPSAAPEAIMRMFKARPIDPASGAGLLGLVRALAQRAGLPAVPRVYLIPSATLNAFAIGTPARCVIGVTSGLLERLDERELRGVLAHEITHVRNNDIWVMSLADILSRLTRIMSFLALFLFFISVPAWFLMRTPVPWAAIAILYFAPTLSSLLQLALSRSREYEADLGGALLTGDPQGLASALRKLERYQGRFWEDFTMPGRRIPLPSVLRTHPETSRRIARLQQLSTAPAPLPELEMPAPEMGGPWGIASHSPRPHFHWSGFWF
jgi:heat shock protein HtpX